MRGCNKCVYHTSGECSSWHCNFATIEDVRNKAIDDFLSELYKAIESARPVGWTRNYDIVMLRVAEDIAEQLKKGEKKE